MKVNPNCSSRDSGGQLRSALHRAAAYGQVDTIIALIEVSSIAVMVLLFVILWQQLASGCFLK